MELFKLFGSIFVNTDAADESMQKTEKNAEGIASKLGIGIQTAAKWGAAIVTGATVAGTAILGMANNAAGTADNIDKMSQKIGISTDAYQEWSYVMGQNGMDVDKLATGMKTLVSQMDSAASGTASAKEIFKTLGVEITDSNGKLKDQETVLNEVMHKLADMENGTEKSRLAVELFGKAGQEMMPMLNQGSSAMDELTQRAHDLGLVMSEEAVDAGVTLGDTMDDIKKSFAMIGTSLGSAVIPVIQQFADIIVDNMPMIQQMVGQLGPILAQAASSVLPVLVQLAESIFPTLVDLIGQLLPPIMQITQAILPVISELLESLLPPAMQIIQTILPACVQLISALTPILEAVSAAFSECLNGILQIATSIIQKIIGVFEGIITFLKGVFTGNFQMAFQGLSDIVKNIFGGIVEIVKAPINGLISLINGFISGLNQIKIPDWVPAIGGMGINIPSIPMLYEGGIIQRAGRVLVGERGPEFLDLPVGAKVSPLSESNMNLDYNRLMEIIVQAIRIVIPELQNVIQVIPDENGIFRIVRRKGSEYQETTGRPVFE